MKKIIVFLLSTLLLFTTLFGVSGCSLLSTVFPKDKVDTDDAVIVSNSTQLLSALQKVTEETKIVLEEGNYSKLTLSSLNYPVTISAQGSVRINGLLISDGVKNVTIEGIAFNLNGVTLGNATNITLKNCEFSYQAVIVSSGIVTNLVVDGCKFVNILNSLTTAIKLYKYDGLTVKNSVFENGEYNALQIGNDYAGGVVKIENNTFKDIGSRVIYLVYVENLVSCEIVGNKFYDNTDSIFFIKRLPCFAYKDRLYFQQ